MLKLIACCLCFRIHVYVCVCVCVCIDRVDLHCGVVSDEEGSIIFASGKGSTGQSNKVVTPVEAANIDPSHLTTVPKFVLDKTVTPYLRNGAHRILLLKTDTQGYEMVSTHKKHFQLLFAVK